MSSFFEELKRRKVYRVAVAYCVVAGTIIQLASAVFPAWDVPNWALRLVIILLLVGFPMALIFAWAFDVTATGIQRTEEQPSPPSAFSSSSRLRRNVILLTALGVLVSLGAGFLLLPRASARRLEKSIAVLPFDNFSDDKTNAYFADGIQDDVLTSLAKIGDLKVISRTSVMQYRGNTHNVRDIGKALGVSAVLEGSVRKEGNRVRVNVQLINAETDQHVWAQEYDRDLTDVFAIQTDLAQSIARELRAQLSPTERAQLARKPTANDEAYLAFVQAHNLHARYEDHEKLKQAEQLYERALQLDPNFALAAANFSQLESWMLHGVDPTPAHRSRARELADRALQLQPELPEAHLALGFSYYYGDGNYDAALREFSIAQRGLPNEAEVHLAIGAIQRRQGRWAESTANLEKAVALDPNNFWPLQNLAFNYQMRRDFAAADETIDRALKIDPKSLSLWEIKAKFAILERGDFRATEEALKVAESTELSPHLRARVASGRVTVLMIRRNFAEALEASRAMPEVGEPGEENAALAKPLLQGIIRKYLHDEEGARASLLKAKELAERTVRDGPDDPARHASLAQTLAYLGEKDAAIAEAKRATELRPESVDAFEGPVYTEGLAQTYAIVGEADKAIDLLVGLMARPSDVTVAALKTDLAWDAIRDNPRFQALLEKPNAKI
jgi:TolB-like protein/Flp pilus assembly protein TadD